MARVRRSFRRRPIVRRYKRRYIRRYRRRVARPLKSGCMVCKIRRIDTETHTLSKIGIHSLWRSPADFTEFNKLYLGFETYQVLRCNIRIVPCANVSGPEASSLPLYVVAPWHQDVPTKTEFNSYLTIDKARIYRGTQVSNRNFVPCIKLSGADTSPATTYASLQWKPKIACTSVGASGIVHYTGLLVMQELSGAAAGATSKFNIIQTWTVKFEGQNTMSV